MDAKKQVPDANIEQKLDVEQKMALLFGDSSDDELPTVELVPANYSSQPLESSSSVKLRIEIPLKKLKGYYPIKSKRATNDYKNIKNKLKAMFGD